MRTFEFVVETMSFTSSVHYLDSDEPAPGGCGMLTVTSCCEVHVLLKVGVNVLCFVCVPVHKQTF